jgi:hypothetical protein
VVLPQHIRNPIAVATVVRNWMLEVLAKTMQWVPIVLVRSKVLYEKIVLTLFKPLQCHSFDVLTQQLGRR